MKKLLNLLNFLESYVKVRQKDKIKSDVLNSDINQISKDTRDTNKNNLTI